MDTNQFVSAISNMKPTPENFHNMNLPPDLIKRYISSFEITRTSDVLHGSTLLELLENYDLSKLDVHDIKLEYVLPENQDYWFFGSTASGDYLAINKLTKQVVCLNYYDLSVQYECAVTEEHFLDALLLLMVHSKEKMLTGTSKATPSETAYLCSLKAGGERYEDFYLSIIE